MPQVTIAGKRVTLRDRLPIGQFHRVVEAVTKAWPIGRDSLTPEEQIGPLIDVVESWELPGDPHDVAAWLELDAFEEYFPLWRLINDYIATKAERGVAILKNSAAPPS